MGVNQNIWTFLLHNDGRGFGGCKGEQLSSLTAMLTGMEFVDSFV